MFIKHKTIKRYILWIIVILLIFSMLSMSAEAAVYSMSNRIIVSLGDSYSSGEGIEKFYGQDEEISEKVKNEDWLAHRSEHSWSGMLMLPGVSGNMADNIDTHWFFAASSGATTEHLLNKQEKEYNKMVSFTGHWASESNISGTGYISPQLDVFKELGNQKADYVTLTLGGNDANFAGIIKEVVLGSTYLNLSGLSDKLNSTWEKFYKKGGINDDLRSSYMEIASHAGEQAHIIVAGYPQLFDAEGLVVSKEEALLVNTAVSNFNNAIAQVVSECSSSGLNISFVSVAEEFEGHEAYSDDPYINKVIFGTKSQDLKDIDVSSAYSMHPNYLGAQVYAKCVQKKIDELERARFFDNTCWVWSKGVTAGSTYAVLFHLDGTLTFYKMNEEKIGFTTYQYENGILSIDGIDYTWRDNHFASLEKLEVHASAEHEEFKLYPDNQERFYELVPSYTEESFVDEIKAKYGKASYTEFVSCLGSWVQKYPTSIEGVITETYVDLDDDGENECLTLISKNNAIYLQVYSKSHGNLMLCYESFITSLDYCMQQNIFLFYSNKTDRYMLFIDGRTDGAYTGNDAKYATIYELTCTRVNLVFQSSADNFGIAKNDIDSKLITLDVPYAQNSSQINNITNASKFEELLEIRHKYFNADPLGGWTGREHHLQLLTPKKRNEPIESVQSWTIIVKSYQGFTEYREETWTQKFESGKKYTILPVWENGEKTNYTVLDYDVDTQERTIEIFMDYPEGSEHWTGLVLDLEENTYYGMGYIEY